MRTSSITSFLLATLGAVLVGGCGTYPLNANMEDSQINAVLAEHFHAGMPVESIKAELTTLRVNEGDTLLYPKTDTRPQVLLARLWPPGGFWIDGTTDSVNFVDVSFVLTPSSTLERWALYDDSIRYLGGEAVKGPMREPMTRVPNYPGKPPPPLDPLAGTH